MTITLRPEHDGRHRTGAFPQSPSQKNEVNEKTERAFGQFERGEFFSSEESRADMEKRKTAWPAENI